MERCCSACGKQRQQRQESTGSSGILGKAFGVMGGRPELTEIRCNTCGKTLPLDHYDESCLETWKKNCNLRRDAVCKNCQLDDTTKKKIAGAVFGKDSGILGKDSGHLGGRPTLTELLCTKCKKTLPLLHFDAGKVEAWQKTGHLSRDAKCIHCEIEKDIQCMQCGRWKKSTDYDPGHLAKLKQQRKLSDRAKCKACTPTTTMVTTPKRQAWARTTYTCSRCEKSFPPHRFDTVVLQRLERENTLYLAECSLCSGTQATEEEAEPTGPPVTCNLCKKLKARTEFSHARQRKLRDYQHWRCKDCDFPACEKCATRTTTAGTKKPYWCDVCKFPPCHCGTPRPRTSKYHVAKMPEWKCPACREGKD